MTAHPPATADGVLGFFVKDERLARAVILGVPAFVRRAQAVESALERLRTSIAAERSKRLRVFLSLARSLEAARAMGAVLPEAALTLLEALRAEPGFAGRSVPPPRSLDRALARLAERVRVFNERWARYLDSVSLEEVREAEEKYNRYYAIERGMALPRAPRLALEKIPLTQRSDLERLFQSLPGVWKT